MRHSFALLTLAAALSAQADGPPYYDPDRSLNKQSEAASAAVEAAQLTGKIHIGTLEISKVALEQVRNGQIEFLINEQPYLDGFYGVLFAYHYVKFGLAPVGMVHTGPSVVDKSNIEKIATVFEKYPNVVGSQ